MSNVYSERYWTLDPQTKLMHIARALAWSSNSDPDAIHATLCDEEVEAKWTKYTEPVVTTCLLCLAAEGIDG